MTTITPEPGSMTLLGSGIVAVATFLCRRMRNGRSRKLRQGEDLICEPAPAILFSEDLLGNVSCCSLNQRFFQMASTRDLAQIGRVK